MIKNYVAFDLETTGLDVEKDSIIEIGALKVLDGKVCDRFMEFVKPETRISSKITEITGITNEMVAHARDTREIICDFVRFCEDYILVGHNIGFDYKFTKKYAEQFGFSFEKSGIDTLRIARKVHKELPSRSLETLCAYYHIINPAAHRAYHDALATAKLYQTLSHHFECENVELFHPISLQYKRKKVQPCTKRQIEYLAALCEKHQIQMDITLDALTRSEASRMIDHIISSYGSVSR